MAKTPSSQYKESVFDPALYGPMDYSMLGLSYYNTNDNNAQKICLPDAWIHVINSKAMTPFLNRLFLEHF